MDRRNLLSTGMVLTLGGLLPAAEADAAAGEAANTNRGLRLDGVSGTTVNRVGQAGTFTGTILIKRVGLDNETRTLKVYGLVNGTATTGGAPSRDQPEVRGGRVPDAGIERQPGAGSPRATSSTWCSDRCT